MLSSEVGVVSVIAGGAATEELLDEDDKDVDKSKNDISLCWTIDFDVLKSVCLFNIKIIICDRI